MRVDIEMLGLEMTTDEYNEYLSHNDTDEIKCCWSSTGASDRGL